MQQYDPNTDSVNSYHRYRNIKNTEVIGVINNLHTWEIFHGNEPSPLSPKPTRLANILYQII